MIKPPEHIELVGDLVAIRWPGGREDYLPMEFLRAHSPSAENTGEYDVLGHKHGGHQGPRRFPGVRVTGWEYIGGYAVRFLFSDGHGTGLYHYGLIQALADKAGES